MLYVALVPSNRAWVPDTQGTICILSTVDLPISLIGPNQPRLMNRLVTTHNHILLK
jgi:hypothetical protein